MRFAISLVALLLVGCQSAGVSVRPAVIPGRVFKVTEFGAVGDGKTVNTEAFAKAIDACEAAGGGNVVVPAGVFASNTYVTGPMALKSDMALVVEKGVTVRGVEDLAAYESGVKESEDFLADEFAALKKPLIGAEGATNVAIRGEGTIDGAGKIWWEKIFADKKAGAASAGDGKKAPVKLTARPRLVLFRDCKNVHLSGVTMQDSPNFFVALYRCDDVLAEGLTITAPENAPNTDGIDPGNCRNVVIRKCVIDVGDDNVSFKSVRGAGRLLEDVLVEDCMFKHGHGTSVGSALGEGVRNITVQRCTFENTSPAIRIKSARDRGALVEDIVYRDLKMKNVGEAIFLNMFYFDKDGQKSREYKTVTTTTPVIRNVRIENVTVDGAKSAGEIVGLPEMPIEDVLLKDVTIRDAGKGLLIRDAKVKRENVTIEAKEGPPVVVE